MTDTISADRRSANMRRIRAKDTKPELIVRRLVHGLGYRYRLHRKDLPGKPDLVFGSRRKVIFVHGCFWHQHPDPNCVDSRRPKSNSAYWNEKLDRNVTRDAEHLRYLTKLGWEVLVIWDCELRAQDALQSKLVAFLDR
ncbi:MAG: DNA mismatch endonuclease Vsr [Pseudomonadota bacterium]